MTELAIIGSGVAGLMASVQAAAAGAHPVLLTKDGLGDSNSELAQGGLSAVTSQSIAAGDSLAAHVADTLAAGAGHCVSGPVQFMCASAQELVDLLEAHAAGFDRTESGEFQLGLEAAHSAHRILHINGDATGAGLVDALRTSVRALQARDEVTVVEQAQAVDLQLDQHGRVDGVHYLQAGEQRFLPAEAVLLATGGIGQVFAATTNPAGATADGLGLAARAGAVIADAEFVQFHPTLVDPARFPAAGMVSEAVRGEGAVLVTGDGQRFMQEIHPDAELAPRDVVARGIHQQLLAGRSVYLDARGVEAQRGAGFLARRFPSITEKLAESGLDMATDLIPVVPAQHYYMGGVYTDAQGRTSVAGLYAAGECANTTVHGANRLASNSLLEAMVFARSAVQAALNDDAEASADTAGLHVGQLPEADAQAPLELADLQQEASKAIGVYRTGAGLEDFAQLLARSAPVASTQRAQHELGNLWTAARFITQAALHRTASLGAHHRLDSAGEPAPGARFGWQLPEAERLQPTIMSKELNA